MEGGWRWVKVCGGTKKSLRDMVCECTYIGSMRWTWFHKARVSGGTKCGGAFFFFFFFSFSFLFLGCPLTLSMLWRIGCLATGANIGTM